MHISPIFSTFVLADEYYNNLMNQSNQNVMSVGRAELAARYFPFIQPQSAWQKLRSLLAEDPDLEYLARLSRRTFLPVEVNKIYQHLGQP